MRVVYLIQASASVSNDYCPIFQRKWERERKIHKALLTSSKSVQARWKKLCSWFLNEKIFETRKTAEEQKWEPDAAHITAIRSGNRQTTSLVERTTAGKEKFPSGDHEVDVAVWDNLPLGGPNAFGYLRDTLRRK
ncbi:hypothetical protein EVAR_63284_1 [Eumeta japonica]|uniref:Uncharacterized protein n=1 Tax=Eumeta variegata TaxID=151549 RepID=A0A4C1ZYM5_EUMVA|nr:hypothetical protein EVAR_63284_1 [Eumeta japonica]